MRVVLLCLTLSALTGAVRTQTLASFTVMEACPDWRCVLGLLHNTDLRLDRSIPWRLPLRPPARISSTYGLREHPIGGHRQLHAGLDLAAPAGTPVYAAAGGRVSVHYDAVRGHYVTIDHLNGFTSKYGHLSVVGVLPGAYLIQGELLGLVGATGRTTGPHLHWSVSFRGQPLNPLTVWRAVLTRL